MGEPETPKNTLNEDRWFNVIRFWVDGKKFEITNPSPSITLLDWMREFQGLTSTHVGCGEGGCGACTLALVLPSGETRPINSCLRRLCAVDGCHIMTTQSLGNVRDGLHPVQEAITNNGTQCGFCTPGWVMNMYSLLENNSYLTREQVEQNFDGNLCRCTGYRPILAAFGEFASGGSCCRKHTSIPKPLEMADHVAKPLHFSDPLTGEEYYRPVTMHQLGGIRQRVESAKKKVCFMSGTTATGVVKYLVKNVCTEDTVLVDVNYLPEISSSSVDESGLTFGAAVSIGHLLSQVEKVDDEGFRAYAEHLKLVASVQVRSVGSWGGNVMLCRQSFLEESYSYFPSDIVLVLATAGTTVKVMVDGCAPQIVDILTLIEMKGNVLLISGHIPRSSEKSLARTFKLMRRHVFTHAIVQLGVHFTFAKDWTVTRARVIIGGVTSKIMVAQDTVKAIVGNELSPKVLSEAKLALTRDIDDGNPNAMLQHKTVACAYLFKSFLQAHQLRGRLHASCESALLRLTGFDTRPVSSGDHSLFSVDNNISPVGIWMPKIESGIQATGESIYPSDKGHGFLFGQLVFSTSCNAKLVAIDAHEALGMPGVVEFVAASDIPGTNGWMSFLTSVPGCEYAKEKLFFELNDTIPYVGVMLGVIVAKTWAQAYKAARAVKQVYIDLKPPVLGIVDASTKHAVLCQDHVSRIRSVGKHILRGAQVGEPLPDQGTTKRSTRSQNIVSSVMTGEQYHFPLETHALCVVPTGDTMQIFISSQCNDIVQSAVAGALGVLTSKIRVEGMRIGGGFGGKIIAQAASACAIAVAAHKLKQPVRLQTERRNDMQAFGLRNSFKFDYDATFLSDGKLEACDLNVHLDVGHIPGISGLLTTILDKDVGGVYNFTGGLKLSHQVCLTNKPAAAVMRAPGAMQASFFQASLLDHIAKTVGKDVDDVMEMNMYKVGDINREGVELGSKTFNYTVPQLWSQIQASAQYKERKAEVEQFNKTNKWKKKGISITASKFGVPSSDYKLGALLTAYVDGSVHVSVGGVDMGQGLNTKVAQCVAYTLGVPVASVTVEGGDTFVCGNQSYTGNSGSSESCCNAAMEAATILKNRLAPFVGKSWTETLLAGKLAGISLSAEGWFNGIAMEPHKSVYATYGAAVSEVILDVLTGDVRVERVDMIVDLGSQLNAAVDIGQIQGGFVQALGYLLTEEVRWGADGTQTSPGTWEYKIPTAYDVPVVLNVSLLQDTPNPRSIALGSKAVAEPIMSLINGTYLALKKAIYASRSEFGSGSEFVPLHVPTTRESIQSAIGLSLEHIQLMDSEQ